MAPWLRFALLPAFFALLFATAAAHAEQGADCFNGVDDDANGLIDCDDPGCGADAVVDPIDLRVVRIGSSGSVDLQWDGAGPGTSVDVAAGALSDLRAGLAGCVFDSKFEGISHPAPHVTDPRAGPGSTWYLVRVHSACAVGDFGSNSWGNPRELEPPCEPPETLAGCDGGPTPGAVSAWTECDTLGPNEQGIHLTNLTDSTVRWLWKTCVTTPRIDTFSLGAWFPAVWSPHCFVCPDEHVEWLELQPGEETMQDVGTWSFCNSLEVVRAWFVVAETCTVLGVEAALEQCPDARVVTTLPFEIVP